jgi:hypothetical protein
MNAADLLNRTEELLPELAEYLVEMSAGMTAIKHPLVFSVPHHSQLNAFCNESYRMKSKLADEMKSAGRFHGYVFLIERPYRFEAFREIADELSDREYWQLLRDVWIDSENIWQNRVEWAELLCEPSRPGRLRWLMDRRDAKALAAMPPVIEIYRGARSEFGLSWSISEEKATWFATRFSRHRPVWAGKVERSKVIAYFSRRGEQEIVVHPTDVTEISKHETQKLN